MDWKPFELEGTVYDLSHLHPRACRYTQPAKGDKPEHTYNVEILFSLHCFTRGLKPGETPDKSFCYSDDRETRAFDFRRYELSKQLPTIFETMQRRKCYHTGRSNFLTIDWVDDTGNIVEYEIFFSVSRSRRRGILNIFMQSAYVRDSEHSRISRRKPIGFQLILFNTLHGKPIKPPQ